MRYAARVDSNQSSIVEALRKAGATVWIIGLPVDLLVGYRGRTWLMEVKRDRKAPYTALQRVFFNDWQGGGLSRVDDVAAALRVLGVIDGGEK